MNRYQMADIKSRSALTLNGLENNTAELITILEDPTTRIIVLSGYITFSIQEAPIEKALSSFHSIWAFCPEGWVTAS